MQNTFLEGDLGALVLGDSTTSTVGRASGTAAASAKAATATATTASTVTTSATTTATTTTAEATTTAAVVLARSAEVQADSATVNVDAVQVVVGLAGLVNRRELHVSETLGAARLGVGRQTDAQDATLLTEDLGQRVLVGAEGDVADEQSVTLRAGLVTERTGTSLGAVLATSSVVGWATAGVIKVDLAAIELSVLLLGVGLGGIGAVGELDVAESTRGN